MEGELLGVCATDALELGIDIGLLDCAISVGFPRTVASLRQQWGRAGRRGHGLAVLVASDDALDQYFMREPQALLGRRVEAAISDHANPRVLDGHVRAAAFEAPLDDDDREILGDEALVRAAEIPELKATQRGYVWNGRDYPAARIPLRSASPDAVTIVDASTGTVLGIVELERAYTTVYEGAVYLHLGESYLVLELDLLARRAIVEPFSGDYYTQAKKETTTAIEEELRGERELGVELSFGRVSVTEQVIAYQKKAIRNGATLDLVPLVMPESTFETEAVWFVPDERLLEGIDRMPTLLDVAARSRAHADRPPAALRDVRPVGHRRPVHQPPLPDRAADPVRLRRAPGRRRHRRARLRRVPGLGRGRRSPARALSVRVGLPVLRAVAEVRQPQRAPRQAGRPHAPRAHALRGACRFRRHTFVVESNPTKEEPVHYMLLIYGTGEAWESLSDAEQEAMYQEYYAFSNDLREQNKLVSANELQPTTTATTVTVRDGDASSPTGRSPRRRRSSAATT